MDNSPRFSDENLDLYEFFQLAMIDYQRVYHHVPMISIYIPMTIFHGLNIFREKKTKSPRGLSLVGPSQPAQAGQKSLRLGP